MQCYAELLPPTGVTHSITVPFTSESANNLILARTSLLQIYSYQFVEHNEQSCLSLIAEYSLQGTISGIARVKTLKSQSGGEAVLLAFRDAKLSLIEWNPDQHSISTISIHYYENHDSSLCPWSPDLGSCITHLTVDPSSRCAAFNFNVHSLAVIPFHRGGDDLAMDDLDDLGGINGQEDTLDELPPSTKQANGDSMEHTTPYAPSFVLSLTQLDSGLLHPVGMTFLYEYREPTIGILYSTQAVSTNMAPERKDVLCYSVYTLDTEQKASTTLLAMTRLPNDLAQVVALSAPIGGTLLIGGNEIVHIDQGGKANAVAVNEFAKQCSAFPMADQSILELRLEGAVVVRAANTSSDLLLLLADGQTVVLRFRTDGRSVSGMSLTCVDRAATEHLIRGRVSTAASLGHGILFVGSEDVDSIIIGTTRKTTQSRRTVLKGAAIDNSEDVDLDDFDDDDDDDDLYADSKTESSVQQTAFEANSIALYHRLPCLAPINDMCIGRRMQRKREDDEPDVNLYSEDLPSLELVLSCNKGRNSSIALLSRSIQPTVTRTEAITPRRRVWALSSEPVDLDSEARPFDDILISSTTALTKKHRSTLNSISATRIQPITENDFEKHDRVIAAGKITSDTHVVVYRSDIRVYNKTFGLDQIFTIMDEEAEATAEVITATIAGGCIQVVKSDRTLSIYKLDKAGDLDEVELSDNVPSESILSACLCEDSQNFFDTVRFARNGDTQTPTILAIATLDGALSIHTLYNLAVEVFRAPSLDYTPQYLSSELPIPKHWRSKDDISEISLSNLGTGSDRKPYLVLRTVSADIVVYEPFQVPQVAGAYRLTKVVHHSGDARETMNSGPDDGGPTTISTRLIPIHDVAGMSVVFLIGQHPHILLKAPSSLPRIYPLNTGPMSYVSQFHSSSCNRGFLYTSPITDTVTFAELPADIILSFPFFIVERVPLNQQIDHITAYPRTNSYVLATSSPAPFHLPRDDEWHPEWEEQHESATASFLPTTVRSQLKLLSSISHSVISNYNFDPDERILSLKTLSLEVSEVTHERRDLIVVGTTLSRGENVVTRGYLYLFDIASVVPHPDIPETDLILKLISKEDVKGAVAAITGIGSQGFLLNSQGQKCMVRGLREDNAILPVAFMDMRYHVSVATSLPGTGLTILGDAFSGLWLVGYSEEPYKMQLLSRDLSNPAVVAAEFLPHEKQLFVQACDDHGELKILQYDPEDPNTERGSLLLRRSTFNTGYFPTLMKLLPRTRTPYELVNSISDAATDQSADNNSNNNSSTTIDTHQILISTQEGALLLLNPLSEQTYRRLSTLQNILTTQLDQPCGLNPRAHRRIETDGIGGRGMIDGQVVRRWTMLSSHHKASLADRAGGTVWDIKGDLEGVLGGGLGFL